MVHYSQVPIRTEYLKVTVDLDNTQYDRYKDQVALFMPNATMIEGDRLKITYDFTAEYYGNIVPRFEALIKWVNDPTICVSASIEELNRLKCLFADLILAIERRTCSAPIAKSVP